MQNEYVFDVIINFEIVVQLTCSTKIRYLPGLNCDYFQTSVILFKSSITCWYQLSFIASIQQVVDESSSRFD